MRKIESWIKICFIQIPAVYSDHSLVNLYRVAWQTYNSLDVTLRRIVRKPENHDVASSNRWGPAKIVVVDQLIDEDSFTIVQARQHRRALDFHRLHNE